MIAKLTQRTASCSVERRAGVARDRIHEYAQFPRWHSKVQEVLRKDLLSGHLFVFRGRRSDLVKVING
ncbi:IS66 family insertion sequence element accessory protein TnpB [Bradyrhizobium yuanmingense]|uniref:IS66 family insertion sequence element accessory protein TnpB n=1 Tax=Bradyrhizobium yuanmingense TaxID=108015 RepID=UPI0023BA205D|nr:IS66 family insertion sequence element accessory protein TnpB [Bradyrhizobium yuanmingense]MDF0498613.1 hypothetical protein [Bradyrhizobium yuanmingense]